MDELIPRTAHPWVVEARQRVSFVIGLLPDDVETAELVAEKVIPAFAARG